LNDIILIANIKFRTKVKIRNHVLARFVFNSEKGMTKGDWGRVKDRSGSSPQQVGGTITDGLTPNLLGGTPKKIMLFKE
jgi:hypothetical protein